MSAAQASPPLADVLVAGGGLAGAAAALAFLRQGRTVNWLRDTSAPDAAGPDIFDARVYAISPGNLDWLSRLGAELDPTRVTDIQAMEIRAQQRGPLRLAAQQAGVPRMAAIVESGHLLAALETAIGDAAGPAQGARIVALHPGDVSIGVSLDDGTRIDARLLVAADGASSNLRRLAGIDTCGKDYQHSAVVAHFACQRPHRGIACQWFDEASVLAWLPLPGERLSMVWSQPSARAEALLQANPEELAERVARAGEHRFGGLQTLSTIRSFPLQRQRAVRLVAPRLALVGDAAHVVHPLAGQGINLGFRDIRELVARCTGNPGDVRALARYQAARQLDVRGIEALTDGLFRLFARPVTGWLGGLGLGIVDALPSLKTHLVRQALR